MGSGGLFADPRRDEERHFAATGISFEQGLIGRPPAPDELLAAETREQYAV